MQEGGEPAGGDQRRSKSRAVDPLAESRAPIGSAKTIVIARIGCTTTISPPERAATWKP